MDAYIHTCCCVGGERVGSVPVQVRLTVIYNDLLVYRSFPVLSEMKFEPLTSEHRFKVMHNVHPSPSLVWMAQFVVVVHMPAYYDLIVTVCSM